MFRRTFAATAVAASMALMSGPAIAQAQGGLVNVNISQIEVEIEEVISDNQVQVVVPAVVQIPVTLAANVCPDVTVAALLALAAQEGDDPVCNATAAATNEAEARAIAGLIRRQQ